MFDALSAPKAHSATPQHSSIEQSLDEGKRASLDYQILRRTLMIEQDEPTPQAPPQTQTRSEPPPSVPRPAPSSRWWHNASWN